MRTSLITLAAASLVCLTGADCCGVGEPELAASYGVDECAYGGCALAIDSEVSFRALTWDVEPTAIADASLDKPTLAELAIADDRVLVRPRQLGEGVVSVTLADRARIQAWIATAHVASTEVVFDALVEQLRPDWPAGRMQMFAGSTLRVAARHADRDGKPLLGHGLEQWSISGGMLVEPAADAEHADPYGYGERDLALVRDVVATDEPLISVAATPASSSVEIEVVPAGSTAKLRIDTQSLYVSANALSIATPARFYVSAFSSDGRYIHGAPVGGALAATAADPAIVSVAVDADIRALRLTGVTAGTTEVLVSFDGVTMRLPVTVRAVSGR